MTSFQNILDAICRMAAETMVTNRSAMERELLRRQANKILAEVWQSYPRYIAH